MWLIQSILYLCLAILLLKISGRSIKMAFMSITVLFDRLENWIISKSKPRKKD